MPDIPVGEAWGEMNRLLDLHMPVAPPVAKGWLAKKGVAAAVKAMWAVGCAAAVVGGYHVYRAMPQPAGGKRPETVKHTSKAPHGDVDTAPTNEAHDFVWPQPDSGRGVPVGSVRSSRLETRSAMSDSTAEPKAAVGGVRTEGSPVAPAQASSPVKAPGRQKTLAGSSAPLAHSNAAQVPVADTIPTREAEFAEIQVADTDTQHNTLSATNLAIEAPATLLALGNTVPLPRHDTLAATSNGVSLVQQPQPVARKTYLNLLGGMAVGLQHQFAIPTYGAQGYFVQTNGKNQPLAALMPGLWVSKQVGDGQSIRLTVWHNANLYTNRITTYSHLTANTDTSLHTSNLVLSKRQLLKVGGPAVSVMYSHVAPSNWQWAAGLGYTRVRKALVRATQELDTLHTLLRTDYMSAQRDTLDWHFVKRNIVTARMEVGYSVKWLTVGVGLSVPVTPASNSGQGRKHPINCDVYLRYSLFAKRSR